MSDEKLPQGIELTPLDDAFCEDPYAVLARVRAAAPVLRDGAAGGYLLTRHDDVMRVLRDKTMSADPRNAGDDAYASTLTVPGEDGEPREPSMLFLDDPEHRRLRGLVNKAFTVRAVEALRPRTAEIASRLLDAVDDAEFDLIACYASPLPTVVIAEMLGVDPARQADFKAWSDVSTSAFFNPFASEEERAAALEANRNLERYFQGEVERRRAEPRDDLIGRMVRAEEEGDRLTDREIVTQCNLLLVAGNVTTTDLIGNGVRALLEHRGQLEKLQRDPSLLPNAVEEMLRYDSPVVNSGRVAMDDVEVGGCPMRRGDSIATSLGAANRDPAVYPDPDRFDVERADVHHQSFGGGVHSCLGAPLARVEAQEALRALLARFPRLRASERGFTHRRTPGFRGLSEYWVRVD